MQKTSHRPSPSTGFAKRYLEEDPRLPHSQAAEYLGINPATLQNWRASRRQDRRIPFIKVGHLVQYRKADLDAFLHRNIVDGPA